MLNNNNSSSRPTISFPVGLALLVLVLVCITGLFSCCYHWNKLRSLLCCSSTSAAHDEDDDQSSSDDSTPSANSKTMQVKEQKNGESLTILMPGDDVPKFVALHTPRRSTLQLEMLV